MTELETKRGLTLRAFLIGLVLVLGWLIYDCTLAVDPPLASIETLYLMGFGAAFTLFVVQMANKCFDESRRLSPAELTVIYAMVAFAVPWGILVRCALEAPVKLMITHTGAGDPTAGWLSSLWTTKSRDAIDMFRRGGYLPWEISWREWRTPILYWSSILLSFQLFAISVVLFFRRIFIDEEKLPFPMAMVGESIIEYRPSKSLEESSRKLRSAVRIAFVVGLLICVPGIVSITPYGYTLIPMNTGYYGTSTGLIPGLSVSLSWDPFVLCFLMFFPLDVLFTVTVFYIGVNIVIPLICLWIGVPKPSVGEWTLQIFGFGGLVGLAFWPAFFHRSLIADAFRRALRGGRSSGSNDPLSFRVVVLGMLLSFTAFVCLFIAGIGDISAHRLEHTISLIACVFVMVGMLLAVMRLNTENGWHYHSPWSVGKVIAYADYHWLGGPPTGLFKTQASFLSIGDTIHFGAFHNTFSPHLHLFDALKVASHTNSSTRDVLKAVLLTLAISLVVVVPGYISVIHYYGFDHGMTSDDWSNFFSYAQAQHPIGYEENPSFFNTIQPWVSIPIGLALIGLVMYLRREYVGFPFSPVGIVMCAGHSYFGTGHRTTVIWFSILIVLVVKRVIYRWFGVGFFRQRVIPVVMFAMMGLMTGMLVYKVIFASMGRGFMRPY